MRSVRERNEREKRGESEEQVEGEWREERNGIDGGELGRRDGERRW